MKLGDTLLVKYLHKGGSIVTDTMANRYWTHNETQQKNVSAILLK